MRHVVVLHGSVVKILPPPQSSMRARPTLSVACAPTSMLLPVQTVPVGFVMDTVGGVVSVLPVVVPVDVEPVDSRHDQHGNPFERRDLP